VVLTNANFQHQSLAMKNIDIGQKISSINVFRYLASLFKVEKGRSCWLKTLLLHLIMHISMS